MSADGSHTFVTKKTPKEKTAAAETSLLARVDALTTSAEFNSALDLAVKPDWADAFSEPTHPLKSGLSRGVEAVGLGQSFKARMCGPLWEQRGELRVTCLRDFFKYRV
jgi:hypothetical protein